MTVLVTGAKVVSENDVALIESAGFGVDRLTELDGTEEQLARALRGKRGYICAGHERVTDAIIAAADQLEVISFPGSGYAEFVPGWRTATQRGIAVCAGIGANAPSVADYTIALMLAMLRLLPSQLLRANAGPWPAREVQGLGLGVIGLGHSGRLVAERAHCLEMTVRGVVRRPAPDAPSYLQVLPLEDVLALSDVVTLHVDRIHGSGVLRGEHFRLMRDGTLLLNVAFPDAVEWDALRTELLQGRLRSAFDAPPSGAYADLPPHIFVTSPRQTAYDTVESNRRLGRMASEALISVLKDGNHPRVINPDFALHRPRS